MFSALAKVEHAWLIDDRATGTRVPSSFALAVNGRALINAPSQDKTSEPAPAVPLLLLYDVAAESPLFYGLVQKLWRQLDAKSFEQVTLLHTALMLHVSTRVCSANDQLAPSDDR